MEKHTTHHHSSTNEMDSFVKHNGSTLQIVMIVLLVINTIFSGLLLLRPSSMDMEQLKVGGSENFAKVMELYNSPEFQKNMAQNIEASLEQVKNTKPSQPNQPTPQANNQQPAGKLEMSQIQSIKKDAYIKGNPNAKLTVIEYSDFQCPYCKKFHDDGTLEKLVQAYPQDVNIIFKNFVVHGGAQKAAEALECIGSLRNTDVYYQAIGAIFNLSDMSIDSLAKLGSSFGVSESDLKECLTSNKFAAKTEAAKQEGTSLFNINGTPGNVIINNETGEFTIIPGAVPYAQFEAAVNKMLGK